MTALIDDTSFLEAFMEGMVSWLEEELLIAVNDDTKAGLVRAGNLQDDPTALMINLLMKTGGDNWRHELVTGQTAGGEYGYTIGGGFPPASTWKRRFILDIELFFDGDVVRADSRKKALVVLSRAHNAIMRFDLSTIPTDTFGEHGFFVQVADEYLAEGGGEGTFIWRGEIRMEVFTDIEPV